MSIESLEELNKSLVRKYGELEYTAGKRRMQIMPIESKIYPQRYHGQPPNSNPNMAEDNYIISTATPECYEDIKEFLKKDPDYFQISGQFYVDPEGNWSIGVSFKPKDKK